VSPSRFLAFYAAILALVTSRHEMYLDEVQPWLFVRNAHNLLPVLEHLRYEAHPALWFVLLYGASHFSTGVITMQCVNFLLAILMAWLILSARNVPMVVRVLLVFGVSVFFTTGVVARDYMLAGMLLVAAARCLLAKPRRHWLGMLLLGLAMNSHFLAIPSRQHLCLALLAHSRHEQSYRIGEAQRTQLLDFPCLVGGCFDPLLLHRSPR
jgi:hypothetical protein